MGELIICMMQDSFYGQLFKTIFSAYKQEESLLILYLLMNYIQQAFRNIPTHISHLDVIGQGLIPQNISLTMPQYSDMEYRQRRLMIGEMSKQHRMGQLIKQVEYTEIEHETWRTVLKKLSQVQRNVMCETYLQNVNELNANLQFSQAIPKINDLSYYLKEKTGFQLKPVCGMINAREFLNCLAFKVFCCGQFIRHHDSLEFAAQPDLIHDYVGHIPMFVDPSVAKISQRIGELSLGASEETIQQLGLAYLQTIEFGICEERGKKKAYGAAIASCISDLKRLEAGDYKLKHFKPFNRQQIEEMDFQKPFEYFYLCHSFDKALQDLNNFGEAISKVSTPVANEYKAEI